MAGHRVTALETAQRVHRIADLMAKGGSTHQLIQYASKNYGIGDRQTRTLISRARALLVEDMSIEREDFLAVRLSNLEVALQEAMREKRFGCVAQLIRLQCELAGLLGKNSIRPGADL